MSQIETEDETLGLMIAEEDNPEEQKEPNPYLAELINALSSLAEAEAKLNKIISFMENALAQAGSPHFKSFWDSRTLCLPLFKQVSALSRAALWEKYTELSKEAKRLKEVFNEQSAFAEEQIEIAIDALEKEWDKLQNNPQKPVSLPITTETLAPKENFYATTQWELNELNTQASRINALRKELIKMEMRLRKKNKFFQRLSAIGDRVFPRRKELIQLVSENFIQDVQKFVSKYFAKEDHRQPLFALREEIKALQNVAKILTLNPNAFTQTRLKLSECWDKLKHLDKERKQKRAEIKGVHQQNLEKYLQRLIELSEAYEKNLLHPQDAMMQLQDVTHEMRRAELGREEIEALRERAQKLRTFLQEKVDQATEAKQQQELEKQRHRHEQMLQLKKEIEDLIHNAPSMDINALTTARDAIQQKIQSSGPLRNEKEMFENSLKAVRDLVAEKKEQALLSLSDDDKQALQQLRDLLNHRRQRRQEAKDQLETLRKNAGSSGLDFERAIAYQQQMNDEKSRVEKFNESIHEIEQRIAELEQKLY